MSWNFPGKETNGLFIEVLSLITCQTRHATYKGFVLRFYRGEPNRPAMYRINLPHVYWKACAWVHVKRHVKEYIVETVQFFTLYLTKRFSIKGVGKQKLRRRESARWCILSPNNYKRFFATEESMSKQHYLI